MRAIQDLGEIESVLSNYKCHLTHSEKRLLFQYLAGIALRQETTATELFASEKMRRVLQSRRSPVEKGQEIFRHVRRLRYPLSDGKPEHFVPLPDAPGAEPVSTGVAALDSRKKLINRYCYGRGIFDLKEYVVSLIRSCPLDCAYCFLREVYADSRFKVPPDFPKMGREIAKLAETESGLIYLNAGENADSMILDREYGLAEKLWSIVKPHPNLFLEFRTKTNKIEKLIGISDHQNRIIAAFSLNPEPDRTLFETNTASIADRIEALVALQKSGFRIGLRLEPIVLTSTFEEKYELLLDELFSRLNPGLIHSVSLGCLRLTKGLMKILAESHPRETAEEWTLCSDGKFRYFRGIRIKIYRKLLALLKEHLPDQQKIFLSTEPPEIWQAAQLPFKTLPEICRQS